MSNFLPSVGSIMDSQSSTPYTGKFFDFIWQNEWTNRLRWSPDGNLLASQGENLKIWKMNQKLHPHDRLIGLSATCFTSDQAATV